MKGNKNDKNDSFYNSRNVNTSSKENKETNDKNAKNSDDNMLDKLFRKTKTKPYIYYLPLTEEQVKQKLSKSNYKYQK